jgi:Aldo/keto reductase family
VVIEGCASWLWQTNVGLLAYSPLAAGTLTGKYISGKFEGGRLNMFPGALRQTIDIVQSHHVLGGPGLELHRVDEKRVNASSFVVWSRHRVIGGDSCGAGYMARFNKSLAREAVAEYVEVARKHGLTGTQLALGFVKSRWFVTSTIIGATSMEQLKVGAFSHVCSALLSTTGAHLGWWACGNCARCDRQQLPPPPFTSCNCGC